METDKKWQCYAAVFRTAAGQIVLQDLKTRVNALGGSESISNDTLRCVYGQQILIRYIETCIKSGEKNNE